MSDERLIVFLKAPRPGQVKTRLAEALGDQPACRAYQQLVDTLLHSLASLADVQLCFTPDDAGPEILPWRRPGWSAQPQGAGDLGGRMARTFHRAFAAGARRAVIIGSDCPGVSLLDIRQAWQGLESHDLVLGPATDGGYWLIGMTRLLPELFEGIPWSTEKVLELTLQRARAQNRRLCLLRTLSDVDTAEDWFRFQSGQHSASGGAG